MGITLNRWGWGGGGGGGDELGDWRLNLGDESEPGNEPEPGDNTQPGE